MKIRALLPLLLLPLLNGCVQVPYSQITFGGATAKLPKDMVADSLDVSLSTGSNTMTFHASKISTKNEPGVINASTAQLEAVINATSAAVGQAAATAAKAAAK